MAKMAKNKNYQNGRICRKAKKGQKNENRQKGKKASFAFLSSDIIPARSFASIIHRLLGFRPTSPLAYINAQLFEPRLFLTHTQIKHVFIIPQGCEHRINKTIASTHLHCKRDFNTNYVGITQPRD